MKKTVLFFLIIILMIGACGCGMKMINNEKENVVPYLQDKYGETFSLVSYEMRSIDIPYDEAVCTNEQGQKVKVYVDYENDIVSMSDNYYGTLIMPQYYEKLRSIIEDHGIECKLFSQFNASSFDSSYNHGTPLAQALSENKEQFYTRTTIFIREGTQVTSTDFSQLCEALLSENMTMYLSIYQMDEDTYLTLDETQKASTYIRSEDGVKPLYAEVLK